MFHLLCIRVIGFDGTPCLLLLKALKSLLFLDSLLLEIDTHTHTHILKDIFCIVVLTLV